MTKSCNFALGKKSVVKSMADLVKIKRGLDIPLVGEAAKNIQAAPKADMYAIVPDDFHGVTPKILVKSGEEVKVGTPLMCDKNRRAGFRKENLAHILFFRNKLDKQRGLFKNSRG